MPKRRPIVLLLEDEHGSSIEQLLRRPAGCPAAAMQIDVALSNGRHLSADIRVTETAWHGKKAYRAALRDITGPTHSQRNLRIAKQTAEQASRMKSQFLANMSHELRTPLNAIIGFSDLMLAGMRGDVAGDEQREYLQYIRSSGAHLLELINGLLDLSKAEAGKLELAEEEVCGVSDLLDVIVRTLETQAAAKSIQLVRAPVESQLAVLADKTKLRQVLLNLATNAVKFTPEGGEVTVAASRLTTGEVQFVVSDTGVGIPAVMIPKAFAAFSQIENAYTSRESEGAGLGLALAKRLAEIHGGAIAMDSKEGEGTRVAVTLPARRTTTAVSGESSARRLADAV